jgi:hypothetical protein
MLVVMCYEFHMVDVTDIISTHMLMDIGCMRQLTARNHKLNVAVSYINFDIMVCCKLNHLLKHSVHLYGKKFVKLIEVEFNHLGE